MDPLEFRILNSAKEGDIRIDGPPTPHVGFVETVEAAKDHPHYSAPLEGENRGRGVASGYWPNFGMKSSVVINVTADGTISLVEGSTDIGGTRASIAMPSCGSARHSRRVCHAYRGGYRFRRLHRCNRR